MSQPLLSVLIPAYEYPEGVGRILAAVVGDLPGEVEIVVSDDSTSRRVGEAVATFGLPPGNLRYQRNAPPLGACANWNALVAGAAGKYCMLLHHDEFPVSPGFLPRLVHELQAEDAPDVIILGCVQVRTEAGRNRLAAPHWLRGAVARHAPGYLFSRNVLGPPAVLVARRELYPDYDSKLTWLIDVDAYYRLLVDKRALRLLEDVRVASPPARSESITTSLKAALDGVRTKELTYLADKYPRHAVLRALAGTSAWAALVRSIERVLWLSFRSVTLAMAWLAPPPVDPEEMRARLRAGATQFQHGSPGVPDPAGGRAAPRER